MSKSHKFSIRLLLDPSWIEPLNDLSQAHLSSRLSLLRRYIHNGMIADLEEMKAGFERLKRIEATKKDLRQKVKAHRGVLLQWKQEFSFPCANE